MSIGNYEAYELGLILNIPINDKVSSRWNFRKLAHQGYYDNLYTEQDSGQLDIAAASARFLIEATENTEIYIVTDYYYDRGDTAPVSYSGNPLVQGVFLILELV